MLKVQCQSLTWKTRSVDVMLLFTRASAEDMSPSLRPLVLQAGIFSTILLARQS